ncbi:MAG: pantetheine-phosphate adenylyltransferase [Anaerolineae bacterium]|nr:pantetheine-phosphate adenylyltransferase [Anaerolineae bacterium]
MTHIAVYPGSFDPIQYGHIDISCRAAKLFDEVIIGVYDRPDKNLMFNIDERVGLARRALIDQLNVRVMPYSVLTVDFARQVGAQVIVRGLRVLSDFEYEFQMALMNRQLAPEIESVCLMTRQDHAFMSSSIVKQIAMLGGDISGMVPPPVALALVAKREEQEDI